MRPKLEQALDLAIELHREHRSPITASLEALLCELLDEGTPAPVGEQRSCGPARIFKSVDDARKVLTGQDWHTKRGHKP